METPRKIEKSAPFDYAGEGVATANPFDTTKLSEGQHTITAKPTLSDGTTKVVSSTFRMDNVP